MTAEDGTHLVGWDFGPEAGTWGGGPTLLLAHGTGLNGRSWTPVAEVLARDGLRPVALDLRGHGASGPSPGGDYPWGLFASDILAAVDELGATGAVIGVGHSAGATALLLAEAGRPGTFARLWAWEPIVATPGNDLRVRRTDLAERARRRRPRFASADEARAHLEGRGIFADFSPAAFAGFARGGLVPDDDAGGGPGGGGVRLACRPEDEALIYESGGAHDAWDQLARVSCPVRVLGGGSSSAVPPEELARIGARLPAGEVAVIAGLGHFGPFADPGLAAADIEAWLGK